MRGSLKRDTDRHERGSEEARSNRTSRGAAAATKPWRYTGAYLDATGLCKLGERYYDPNHGRFTQQDPIVSLTDPVNWNRYVYAGNNPINHVDPTGMFSWSGVWDFTKCMFREVVGGFADVVGGLRSEPELTSPYAWGAAGVAGGAYVASWGFTWAPAAGAGLTVAGAGLIIYWLGKSAASCT